MALGRRITELRMNKRESLQQVADAVGVSKAHIWELEKGRTDNPSMALVTRLADHFEVSVSFLVGEAIEAPDADVDLQRMFRQASDLDPRERQILDSMLKSLLQSRVAANDGQT
ncbi:helix-turn-helix domain-containing protein [Nitratireductor sp. CAU 1489]|uniref:Helix-turn-helix domain-containing protein n=1 Tax=Nitratireductor arenosus TaxID=2682096 RepID=A0A844QEP5_9HYPH|nr:helix-turn-helix transcriptional regulator [Nitratireductor arenosus]MVA96279.1 helix-turn-helix domain-containing protein [Nitratireductor arenosus]